QGHRRDGQAPAPGQAGLHEAPDRRFFLKTLRPRAVRGESRRAPRRSAEGLRPPRTVLMPAAQDQRTLSAGELPLASPEAEGVPHIFGIPGGPLMPLYEAIFARGKIRPVLTKHEEGAAFMADGYARVSGRLGVACATTGPGATNALTGIACAR